MTNSVIASPERAIKTTDEPLHFRPEQACNVCLALFNPRSRRFRVSSLATMIEEGNRVAMPFVKHGASFTPWVIIAATESPDAAGDACWNFAVDNGLSYLVDDVSDGCEDFQPGEP